MGWKDLFPKENRYFETDNGILYCGNCLEIMQAFPKGSINLILTDPPYQVSRGHNFDTLKDRRNKRTGTYFGSWDFFEVKNWEKIADVVAKDGSIITFMAFE